MSVRGICAATLVVAAIVVASCGGGTTVVEPSSDTKSFRVQQFFQNILERGASYSMRGEFQDGNNGSVSQQQHDQQSFAIEAFAGQWRGLSNLRRRQVSVTRVVDGAPGVVDVYYGYFDANNVEIGSQADGASDYILYGPHVRRPVSAQIGDTGGGPDGQHFMGDGSVRDRFVRWSMQAAGNNGQYCETVTESDSVTGDKIWDQTWCYSMAEDGTPVGEISYSYDAGGGFTGQIADNNIRYPLTGTAPPPSTERPDSYKVAAYFEKLRDKGATYTMIGEFNNGNGGVTQQVHTQSRLPAEQFGQYKGFANTQRQVVTVARTVDGLPGRTDTYNRYYDIDGVHVITQTGGESEYRQFDLYRNRPVSAQIGDSGSGPDSLILDANGQQIGKRTLSRWEMTTQGGTPMYCETIDETDSNNQPVWQFKWCYEMATDGTPGPKVIFSYDSGGGSIGELVATDLVLIDDDPPPPPPPLECQVDCEKDNDGF